MGEATALKKGAGAATELEKKRRQTLDTLLEKMDQLLGGGKSWCKKGVPLVLTLMNAVAKT